MITMRDIAWFAGLYEGEGTVSIERSKLVPRVHIEMTDEDVIRRAVAITGGHFYKAKPRASGSNPHWKDVYRLVLNHDRGMGWLMTILPFLGLRRREQAIRAIQYWKSRTPSPNGWPAHWQRVNGIAVRPTHCKRGHLWEETNIYRRGGRIWCRACSRLHRRKYELRQLSERRAAHDPLDLHI